jgi:hypothetical protein
MLGWAAACRPLVSGHASRPDGAPGGDVATVL